MINKKIYRVILLSNGEYKSTLYRFKKKISAFKKFKKLKDSNDVIFPKKYINSHKIKPVNFEICVSKITEETDFKKRDENGVFIEPRLIGDWTILAYSDYDIEEEFWILGYNGRKDRPNINTILKMLFKDNELNILKRIMVLHNKVIIDTDDTFDMILCKCPEDAVRLNMVLYKLAHKKRVKNLVFMGKDKKIMISEIYELIQENTGWTMSKIRRKTTRP